MRMYVRAAATALLEALKAAHTERRSVRIGPGRRSCLKRVNSWYGGAHLRSIRAVAGVGRPPRRVA